MDNEVAVGIILLMILFVTSLVYSGLTFWNALAILLLILLIKS